MKKIITTLLFTALPVLAQIQQPAGVPFRRWDNTNAALQAQIDAKTGTNDWVGTNTLLRADIDKKVGTNHSGNVNIDGFVTVGNSAVKNPCYSSANEGLVVADMNARIKELGLLDTDSTNGWSWAFGYDDFALTRTIAGVDEILWLFSGNSKDMSVNGNSITNIGLLQSTSLKVSAIGATATNISEDSTSTDTNTLLTAKAIDEKAARAAAGAYFSLWFSTNAHSSISDYGKMESSVVASSQTVTSVDVTNNQILGVCASETNDFKPSMLYGGHPIEVEFYAYNPSATGDKSIAIKVEIYKRTGATETLIGTTIQTSPITSATIQEYILNFIPTTNISWTAGTDILVAKGIAVVTGSGNEPEVNYVFGGSYDTSISIPLPAGQFVFQADYDSGTQELFSAIGTLSNNTWSATKEEHRDILVQDPTNSQVYWRSNPFGAPATVSEIYIQTEGVTGLVDVVRRDRAQGWTTYTTVATGLVADVTGVATASTIALTNNQFIGATWSGLDNFNITNKIIVDFQIDRD